MQTKKWVSTAALFCLSVAGLAQIPVNPGGGGGGGGASATVENVFPASGGTINFQHNLNTPNPLNSCYSQSGATSFTVAKFDANNVAVSTSAAADIVCAFAFAPAPTPNFQFTVTGSPTLYVPTLAATQTVPLTVTQTPSSGYTASTTYSLSGLPSGLTGAFSPNPITGGTGTSTLTMSFPYSQTNGSNGFTVSGIGGGNTHTQTPAINIATTNTGLLGGWPMNEGSGTSFFDVVAANNATFTSGITYGVVTGVGSLPVPIFAGTGHATAPSTTAYNFTGATPFSVSFWVKPTNVSAAHSLVSTISNSAGSNPGWGIDMNTGGAIQFFLFQTPTTNGIGLFNTTSSITAGTVHHVMVTCDGSKTAAGVLIYVDGVSKTNTVSWNTLTGSAAGAQPLTFGGRADNSETMVGTIAYTRIFNRALTPTEVTTLFAAGPQ